MKSPCVKVCKIKKGIDYISFATYCGRTFRTNRDWTIILMNKERKYNGETKWSTQVCCQRQPTELDYADPTKFKFLK